MQDDQDEPGWMERLSDLISEWIAVFILSVVLALIFGVAKYPFVSWGTAFFLLGIAKMSGVLR